MPQPTDQEIGQLAIDMQLGFEEDIIQEAIKATLEKDQEGKIQDFRGYAIAQAGYLKLKFFRDNKEWLDENNEAIIPNAVGEGEKYIEPQRVLNPERELSAKELLAFLRSDYPDIVQHFETGEGNPKHFKDRLYRLRKLGRRGYIEQLDNRRKAEELFHNRQEIA